MSENMEFTNWCPECGKMVRGELVPYSGMGIAEMMGIGKTNHYERSFKCVCGAIVQVSLHVTAITTGE
jgi:hypothetical protein